jgi:superfamily I DNA and/or RNA helicase
MKPFTFINIRGNEIMLTGGSYANQEESMAVLKLIQKIAARNVPGWDSSDKLRIITFYNGQVALLRNLLSKRGYGKVTVASVDSSQGSEADVVIISFVRSSSKQGVRHAAGFLSDDRRINVALTRARHQLICVGDAHGTLGQQGSVALRNLVAHAKRKGSLI